jgi:hypothetical protein
MLVCQPHDHRKHLVDANIRLQTLQVLSRYLASNSDGFWNRPIIIHLPATFPALAASKVSDFEEEYIQGLDHARAADLRKWVSDTQAKVSSMQLNVFVLGP